MTRRPCHGEGATTVEGRNIRRLGPELLEDAKKATLPWPKIYRFREITLTRSALLRMLRRNQFVWK